MATHGQHMQMRGFSLIELLIVMVIVAILAAIAYPSYRNYIVGGEQSNAQQFLMNVASRAQQYRLDNGAYPETLSDLNMTVEKEVDEVYTINLDRKDSETPTRLEITATPKSGTVVEGTPTLSLDNTGVKQPADAW